MTSSLLLLTLAYTIHVTSASIESFITASGKLICPHRTNFTSTIRLLEADTTVNDFGAQYIKKAEEITDAYSSISFASAAFLQDGWLDYEVEPFLQIIHDCRKEGEIVHDDEEKFEICIGLPPVGKTEEHFPLGNIDLTSTWTKLPNGGQQKECVDYGNLLYATKGSRLVLLGGVN